MQNDSLDSFYLEDYVLDTAEFFSDYIIQEGKIKFLSHQTRILINRFALQRNLKTMQLFTQE